MKTLHLTNCWHATSGGIATFYRALMDAANRRGHLLRLIVPGETDGIQEIGDCVRIYSVKAPPARFNSRYRTIYPIQFLPAASRVQKILAVERPDLVEICDKYTLNYLGALLRRRLLRALDFRPVVVGLSCERMDDNFRTYITRVPLQNDFCSWYVKWIYFPFFDHHIANSEYTAGELRTASRGQMVHRNVWVRPMGVDTRHFSPERKSVEERRKIQQRAGLQNDSIVLLYAGRLVPEKNLALLFDVFAKLVRETKRDFRLIIAGDGIERSRWESFCASHTPGRATFLGHVQSPSDLATLLANSDAFIHPNHREPFGIAPLEAMASGLPAVVPNCGGVMSYANPENAWIASPHSESFVAATEALFRDDQERARRAQNAIRTAAEFSWDKVAGSFLDLYADIYRAFVTHSANLPASSFSSTPAKGMELVLSRGVSQGAEKIFRLASAFFSGPTV